VSSSCQHVLADRLWSLAPSVHTFT